jgi:HEAT repeat protein
MASGTKEMIGKHRRHNHSLAIALAVGVVGSAFLPSVGTAQDIRSAYESGIDLLRRGRTDEAVVQLKKVLAANPDGMEAYELFRGTDNQIWLDLLVSGGEAERVARGLLDLVNLGRKELRNDPEAIRALVTKALSDNATERRAAVRQLSIDHGEFAVPALLTALADQVDEDRRISAMHALTQMSSAVVVPLIEALETEDAFLRRSIALTLGTIADPVAEGPLGAIAQKDEDPGVREAAASALTNMNATRDPLEALLETGNDYHFRRQNVLSSDRFSSVVWTWDGVKLSHQEVPRALYNDELARRSYGRALRFDPTSLDARAGLVRSVLVEAAEAEALKASGVDVTEGVDRQVQDALVRAHMVGTEALNRALEISVRRNDLSAGLPLARELGNSALAPTPGLEAALVSGEGALRAEAALAIARLSLRSGAPVTQEVVSALADAAGREVVRVVAIVDGDQARAQQVGEALEANRIFVTKIDRGTRALNLLGRVAGLDALVVAETLPDLAASQVINSLRAHPGMQDTPVVVLAVDAAAATEVFGDSVQAAATGADAAQVVAQVLEERGLGERERLRQLARDAASALAKLGEVGTDVSSAAAPLAEGLETREDQLALPSMQALAFAGGQSEAGPLFAVLTDESRSDEIRTAAGEALARLLARSGGGLSDQADSLRAVVESEAASSVRSAAAQVLGAMDLDPALRAALLAPPPQANQ